MISVFHFIDLVFLEYITMQSSIPQPVIGVPLLDRTASPLPPAFQVSSLPPAQRPICRSWSRLFLHHLPLLRKAIINSEDNIEEIRAIFNSKPLCDAMNAIEQENDIVIIETYATIKAYLATTRARRCESVSTHHWNNDSHFMGFAKN
jgi:hypothetical protein